jgi:branched-chain amino acid aminotransferase
LITLTTQEAIHIGGTYGLIQELWVHPAHRNQNIGENLIKALEIYCLQQRISRIEVGLPTYDFHSFSSTYHFYQKSGFMDSGPRMQKMIG